MNSNLEMLKKAINIAYFAHENQVDKGGAPYILHPLRVMACCDTIQSKIVAVLHDVIEDTNITLKNLKQDGFSEEILTALDCITKKEGEKYTNFIERISKNKLATKVKIQDLLDNLDETRLNGKKHWKSDVYKEALNFLRKIK